MSNEEAVPVDANVLRRIAETVHSLRDDGTRYVVVEPPKGDRPRTYQILTKPDGASDVINIPVTGSRVVDGPEMTDLTIHFTIAGATGKRKIRELFEVLPDAVFWSESAVQKFMLPYYASKLSADRNVTELLNELLEIMRPREASAESDPSVIGLVHLPNSEYSTVDLRKSIGVLECSLPKSAMEPVLQGMTLEEYQKRGRGTLPGEVAEERVTGDEGA